MKKNIFKFVLLLLVVFAAVYSCIDDDLAQPNQQSSNQQNNINESRLIKFDEIQDQDLIDEIQKNEKILNQLLINIPELFNLSQKEGVESSFILEKNAILSIQSPKSSPAYTLQVRLISSNETSNEVLYNLLISSDFSGKYDGQLIKYETEFKENSTSTNQNNDLKVYTFDLRELEKQSILQEVKTEVKAKKRNGREISTSLWQSSNVYSRKKCSCEGGGSTTYTVPDPSNNPNNSGQGGYGGGSGQGVTNDILAQAGYGHLISGYIPVFKDPCAAKGPPSAECLNWKASSQANSGGYYNPTTPIKTYNINDVKVPLGNGTTGSLNSYINYQLPGMYELIQEYYGSYTFQEEHEKKQLFIAAFINYMYDLKSYNNSHFEYLSNNKEFRRAVFYFFEKDKQYEYSSQGVSFTGENKPFVKSFIDYHKNLTFEQKKYLDDNPWLTKETYDFFKNNGGVTEENKIINNTFLDYLIANRKNALSSLSSYFPSRDQLIQQVKNAITRGITSTASIMQKLYLRLESYSNKYPSTIIYSNQYIINPIRNQVKSLVNFNVNTMSWGDLFNIWLFELDNGFPIFFPDKSKGIDKAIQGLTFDSKTKIYNGESTTDQDALKNTIGVKELRDKIIKETLSGKSTGSEINHYWTYNVNAFYSTVSKGNLALNFLGSHSIKSTIVKKTSNTVTVKIFINNISGWESATRFVKTEKGNQGIINNKDKGKGLNLGGNFYNEYSWEETIKFK